MKTLNKIIEVAKEINEIKTKLSPLENEFQILLIKFKKEVKK